MATGEVVDVDEARAGTNGGAASNVSHFVVTTVPDDDLLGSSSSPCFLFRF